MFVHQEGISVMEPINCENKTAVAYCIRSILIGLAGFSEIVQ
jgi:hypothetical protein